MKGRNVSPKYLENISTQGDVYHDIPASILPKSRPYVLEVIFFMEINNLTKFSYRNEIYKDILFEIVILFPFKYFYNLTKDSVLGLEKREGRELHNGGTTKDLSSH